MSKRACVACGMLFVPRPQIRNQQFCSNPQCQRERRRRKQAEARASNPERRANDAQYYRDWLAKNPDYWKSYRAGHPEYAQRNRIQQQRRNKDRSKVEIAKDDAWPSHLFAGGLFRLTPVTPQVIANEDVWIVEITVLSGYSGFWGGDCKVKP